VLLVLAGCAIGVFPAPAVAAAPPEPCPISYSQLQMPYSHLGGISTPTVHLTFTNETRKKIVRAKFGLIVIDSDNSRVPYDQGLSFTAGADPGKAVSSEWRLDFDKVDFHRLGETVYLKSVRFEDNTTWVDDGNQRCRQEVYYGPK